MTNRATAIRLAIVTTIAVLVPGVAAEAAVVGVTVADFSFSPATVKAPQGTTVEWAFQGPSEHTTTAVMGLWDSGRRDRGARFSFTFVAAGKYAYRCSRHPDQMKGNVTVPVKVSPRSGGTASTFTVTWASSTLPANHVADVELRRPGSTSFVAWKTAQLALGGSFTPDAGPGTYSFRARLRNTASGKASSFSPLASISVG